MSKLVYVEKSPIHGRGLFAARDLPKGKVLGRIKGSPTREDGTYVLWLTNKWGIEITNRFRFINHSDKPNVVLTGEDVVTLRKIRKDEELTHNYYG